MDVPENFEALLQNNKGRFTDLNYGLPELDEDNLRYFSNNLNSICDQIHTLIRTNVQDSRIEEAKWKFMEFLSTKGAKDNLSSFVSVLKEVEENFSDVVDAEVLFGSNFEKEYNSISPTLISILSSIETQYIDRAMSKLREAIRIMRANRLSIFS